MSSESGPLPSVKRERGRKSEGSKRRRQGARCKHHQTKFITHLDPDTAAVYAAASPFRPAPSAAAVAALSSARPSRDQEITPEERMNERLRLQDHETKKRELDNEIETVRLERRRAVARRKELEQSGIYENPYLADLAAQEKKAAREKERAITPPWAQPNRKKREKLPGLPPVPMQTKPMVFSPDYFAQRILNQSAIDGGG